MTTAMATGADLPSTPAAQDESRSFLRYLADHNPLYLLSAICMLAGCLALTNSFSSSAIPLRRLLVLMATLNVYEFLLIALALYLAVKRGLRQDATMLLIVEAFFLVDITFLNSELFTASLTWGATANALQLVLAAVKVGLIVTVLGLRFSPWTYGLVMLEVFVLLASAGWSRWTSQATGGWLPLWSQYLTWWTVAAVLALIVARPIFATAASHDPTLGARRAAALSWLLVLLPAASLLLHVPLQAWVYKASFWWGNIAPVLLAAAVISGRCHMRGMTQEPHLRLQTALIILAILLSASFPYELTWPIGRSGIAPWLVLSPWRLALLAAALVYLDALWLHRRWYLGCAAASCLLAAGMGPSAAVMGHNLHAIATTTQDGSTSLWNRGLALARRLTPTTAFQWGVISIVSAFLLLAAGAVVSLRKGGSQRQDRVPLRRA